MAIGCTLGSSDEGFVVARAKMSGTESPAITHHSYFMSTPANESLLFLIFLTEGENTAWFHKNCGLFILQAWSVGIVNALQSSRQPCLQAVTLCTSSLVRIASDVQNEALQVCSSIFSMKKLIHQPNVSSIDALVLMLT